ncbi:MAG: hypothetical protein ACRDSG_05115 [Pseudonocardiaceae bacterium]
MKGTGESAAVLAATLVWLALLAFPVGLAVSGTQPAGRLIAASAAVALLVGVYVQTAIAAARHGTPRPAPAATVVVAGIAVLLPLVGGSAWLGVARGDGSWPPCSESPCRLGGRWPQRVQPPGWPWRRR